MSLGVVYQRSPGILILLNVIFSFEFSVYYSRSYGFDVVPEDLSTTLYDVNGTSPVRNPKYEYPITSVRPQPEKLLGWRCCLTVKGYSRGGFCVDECATDRNTTHIECRQNICQCKSHYHEENGTCVPDNEVNLIVLTMVYIAGTPLFAVTLIIAAITQYIFDRYLFAQNEPVAAGPHEAEDMESDEDKDAEAGHRVQFADGGRPDAFFEYDWAYEDWHADNPEDKLSQMLLGALSKGSTRGDLRK